MLETIKKTFQMDISMKVNIFIFYFKKIPFIGKLFSDKIYMELELKRAISIIVLILIMIKDLLKNVLYLMLFIYLPIKSVFGDKLEPMSFAAFGHLLFVLSFLLGAFFDVESLGASRKKLVAVKYMKVSVKPYMISNIFISILWKMIYFVPGMILFTILLGGTFLQGFILLILLTFTRFFGEAFNLYLFQKAKINLAKNLKVSFSVIAFLLAAAYIPLFCKFSLPTINILLSISCVVFIILTGFLSIRYIINFTDYKKVFYAVNNIDDLNKTKRTIKQEQVFSKIKIKDQDYDISLHHSNKYSKKSGYAYLNALFFERHRRMLLKPVYIFVFSTLLCLICGAVAIIYFRAFDSSYINIIQKRCGTLVFIMYTISLYLAQNATKAMFYNCDISLLRYSFYRQKDVILSNFTIRLQKVILINGIPAAAIAAGLLILGFISNAKMVCQLIPISLLILILSIFFSVHHLFMYYAFQPYTTELNMKNPFYKVINLIMYFLCLFCLYLNQTPPAFVWIVLSATIIYTVIALILVLKLAPNNFRVK